MMLSDVIPMSLRSVAIPLSDLGVDDVAWRAADALQVIDYLRGTSVAIAGGDLYRVEPWGIAPMADDWRCDSWRGEMATSYADRSRKIAVAFIRDSQERLGDSVLYLLLFSMQQDAA